LFETIENNIIKKKKFIDIKIKIKQNIKFNNINNFKKLKFIFINIKTNGIFWTDKSKIKLILFIIFFNLNIQELKGKIPILTNNIKIIISFKLYIIKKIIKIEEKIIIIK